MQQPLLLYVLFFFFLQSSAQTRKNLELSPGRATTASSRIFHDGTFEIRFDNTVYSFDSGANQWREPVVVEDLLKKKEHLSVVDEERDIRYTIDLVLAGTGTAEARHPQVIRAEKLGGTGQFYQDIPYTIDEAWLPPKLARESGFAWRMTNGDPAFVRFYTWTERGEWQSKALQYILHLSDNSIEVTHLMNGRIPLDKTLNTMAWGNVIGVVGGKLIFSVSYIEDFRLINQPYPEHVKTDFWSVDNAGIETKLHTIEVVIPSNTYWKTTAPVETSVQSTDNALFFQHVYLRKVGSDDMGLYYSELHARVVEIDEDMQVKEYTLDIPWQDMLLYNPTSYQLLSCWQNGDERAFHIALPDELGSTTVNIFRPTADSSYVMTFVPEVPFTKTSTEYAEVIFRPEAERGAALLDVVIHPEDVSRICRDCPRKKYATVLIAEDGTANILVLDLLLKGGDKITYARARYEQVLPLVTEE